MGNTVFLLITPMIIAFLFFVFNGSFTSIKTASSGTSPATHKLLGVAQQLLILIAINSPLARADSSAGGYGPLTYCQWNRTGLSVAQQKICLDMDQKNRPKVYLPKSGEIVTALIPNCSPNGGVSCNDDVFQKVWLQIEANTGEVTKVDMISIHHATNGSALLVAYTSVPNTMFDPNKLQQYIFDCRGHFQPVDNSSTQQPQDAPPRSVAGKMAAIACAGASDTRLKDAANENQHQPSSVDYCSGFTLDACERMKQVVDAKIPPDFCRPGFGRTDSGLTDEQQRVCYVMTSSSFH